MSDRMERNDFFIGYRYDEQFFAKVQKNQLSSKKAAQIWNSLFYY
jgi:hypothetical protein